MAPRPPGPQSDLLEVMVDTATRSGGYGFLSFSIVLCGALYFSAEALTAVPDGFFRSPMIALAGVPLSVLAVFLGQASYPRVQNLKVYLAGSLTGAVCLAMFLLALPSEGIEGLLPRLPGQFVPLLLLLAATDLGTAFFLPDFATYRTTRASAAALLIPQLFLILAVRFSGAHAFLDPLSRLLGQPAAASVLSFGPPVLAALLLVLQLTIRRKERFLGGVFAGTALVAGFGSVLRTWLLPPETVDPVLFCALPLILSAGILAHWFTRLEHRVLYDPLLQIYGRTFCEQVLAGQSSLDTRPPFSIAMVDIDRFKRVNDTLGHPCGDRVLHRVAQTVRREVVPDGIVCRYGGEELAVFFPRKRLEQILPLLERVRAAVERTAVPWEQTEVRVTISCGAACRLRSGVPLAGIVSEADRALYRAKEQGRNRIVAAAETGQEPEKVPGPEDGTMHSRIE